MNCRIAKSDSPLRTPRCAAKTICLVAIAATIGIRAAASDSDHLRLGFSSAMFTDVNENDAKASVKAWGQTVAKERNIQVEPESAVFKDVPAMEEALQNKNVDALGITALEYADLCQKFQFAPIFITDVGGKATAQYLLLVNSESAINSLADLRGRSIAFHTNPRTCLAHLWLDSLLIQQGLKPATEFAGKVTADNKIAKVVLPVFFKQCDACVVTRSGFETMAELNPQLNRQLKVIATSPEVIPALFCVRSDYAPNFRDALIDGVRNLGKTPSGRQVLTVFQSEGIEEQPASCMASSLELIANYRRLCGTRIAAETSATVHTP